MRSYQVGWLAQALLEPQARNVVARKLAENAPELAVAGGFNMTDAADVSIAAQMMTDLATGQLGSGMGSNVGAAVFIGASALSWLSGDGSLKTTNVVLLPAEFDGQRLDTADQAKATAQQLMVERYGSAAAQFGYSFKCEYSCDAFPSIYRMQRKTDTDTSRFIYAADDIAVYFVDFEIVTPEKTQAVDSLAAGFNVEWRTHFNNDAAIYLMQSPTTDEQGQVKVIPTENMDAGWTIAGDNSFFKTDFGDAVLREVYTTPYMLYGTANNYPRVAYYDGVVYQYVLNSTANAFNKVVLPFHPVESAHTVK